MHRRHLHSSHIWFAVCAQQPFRMKVEAYMYVGELCHVRAPHLHGRQLELFEWIVCFVRVTQAKTGCRMDLRQRRFLCGSCNAHPLAVSHILSSMCSLCAVNARIHGGCGATHANGVWSNASLCGADKIYAIHGYSHEPPERSKISKTHNIHFVIYVRSSFSTIIIGVCAYTGRDVVAVLLGWEVICNTRTYLCQVSTRLSNLFMASRFHWKQLRHRHHSICTAKWTIHVNEKHTQSRCGVGHVQATRQKKNKN